MSDQEAGDQNYVQLPYDSLHTNQVAPETEGEKVNETPPPPQPMY